MRLKSTVVLLGALALVALGVKSIMDFARTQVDDRTTEGHATNIGADASHSPELLRAAVAAYTSTLAAFDSTGDEATDYAGRDARAAEDAAALQRALDAVLPGLTPDLRQASQAFVDNIASAQLQIMAFAINRKNRGLPDSAEAEAEKSDLKEFKRSTEPLYKRLVGTLS